MAVDNRSASAHPVFVAPGCGMNVHLSPYDIRCVRRLGWNGRGGRSGILPWVLRALREQETAWVNIDEPRLGASLHGTDYVTAPIAYLRLHGRNYKKWFNSKNRDERYDYLYKPDELEPIAKSLEGMARRIEKEPSRRQKKKILAATNNHYKGQAAVNAIDLKRLLGIKDNPVPKTLAQAYPRLMR